MIEKEKKEKYEELRKELIAIIFSMFFSPERVIGILNDMDKLYPDQPLYNFKTKITT